PVQAPSVSAVLHAARRCGACGKTFRYRSNLLEH
uniref:C2H2-type domain-containing protein n=1 Tax=Propithecus coquereli TaxID=379532 RepID=A0A2K6F1Y1_PROCO